VEQPLFRCALASLLILSVHLVGRTPPTSCGDVLDSDKPSVALAYLLQDREFLSDDCIVDAMHIVARQGGYAPAIPTLVNFLDFERPHPAGIPLVILQAGGPTTDRYPAADALATTGKVAIPQLKKVITEETETSKVKRINAARVLFFVADNKPEAIRFIVNAAKGLQDQETAAALTKLAGQMISHCPSRDQEECKSVITSP